MRSLATNGGVRLRWMRIAAAAAAMAGLIALLPWTTAGAATAAPAAKGSAVVVRERVAAPGTYMVSIVVRSPIRNTNRVDLQIGGVARRAVTDPRHRRVRISVRVHVGGRSLTVRAVGHRARPILTIALRHLATPPPISATGPTTPTPAPLGPPPGPGSPYTTLAWSDDFAADWAGAGGSGGATEPVPGRWGFDQWGGCGTSPPQLSSNSGSPRSAYLTSGGLALPAVWNGSSYTTAQLDTGSIGGESWQYGTIEASIQLPTGQGLCPAFWMRADNGTGELDILEAPSFVGSQWGPLAPFAIATLHSGNVQQFESHAAPAGWNAGAPNVYGVIWTPTTITWTLNYVPYASTSASSLGPAVWSAFTSGKFHLIIDEAVGGWPGDPPAGTVYTQPMLVQWVKVFQ